MNRGKDYDDDEHLDFNHLPAIDISLDTSIANKQYDEQENDGYNVILDLDKTEKNIQYEKQKFIFIFFSGKISKKLSFLR